LRSERLKMLDLDQLTPEQYRARYAALQDAARARAGFSRETAEFRDIAEDSIISHETVPAGCYVALRLRRSEAIRIINPKGTPGAAIFLWNADDVSERYNGGDTLKLQWTANLTTGRLLFSDMGRVLAAITDDTGAGHDSILGTNTKLQTGAGRNGRDNLRLAAAKFGLTRQDVGACLSLFSRVATDEEGRLNYEGPPPAGAMTQLRAEMNLLIALSNTPHVLSPAKQATGPILITVFQAPPPTPDDICRNFSDEAARGFVNTESYFR
jgi:urea carboxylase-associated protein 2